MGLEIRRENSASSALTIKLTILLWLTLQNSIHNLLLRYSRVREVPKMYFSSVAVFSMEIIKIFVCILMVINESDGFNR